ncbi:MAG: MBG domain-containing protein, partial [Bacillota bacterium]
DDGDDFEFSASAGSGFSAEYRLLDETVIDDNNDVLASELASIVTAGKNIYVRFVQTVNVATYGSSDSEELGTYYEGQSISIAVPITSGNYFAGIYDGSETAISTTNTYTDSTNTATAVFKWAVGVNTYYTLTKEIDTNIDTNGVSEQYDGTEQSYSYSDSDSDDYKLLKGYSCSATSSGRLINVGDYIITITISDTNGVKCGYATTSYTITPIQLTVTEGMVNLVKEFDNSTAAVATQMLSYPENIVSGDDIVISATLTFDETKISTGLKATINLVLSGTASGNYVFLSGTASGNYVLSATSLSFTTNSAEITKKKIVFEISASELTKVYDGKSGIIYNYGLAYGYSAVSSDFPIKEYIYIHSTDATSTDTTSVGVYDVLITYDPQFITDSYNSSDYYIVDFKIAYTYEITAKEVDVTFTSNQADYNGATQVLSASYTDISGKTVLVESNGDLSLTYYLYNAETAEYEEVYEFINTGEYMVIASLSTNYCLSSTIDAENNINACYFEITKATQPEITFEVTGKYTFGDDAFDLSEFVTASNNDDTTGASIYFEVYSGYGAIVEDTTYLSLIGAGDIVINAIMPESTNYNSGYASYTITVAYQSLVITTEQTTYKISYGSDLSLEFIFEGFEDGEEPTDFVAPSITYYNEDMEAFTDVTKLDVGTYSIVCANDATSAGYSITSDVNIDITLTVVQLEVSVTIDSFSVSYGDTEITEFTYTTAVDSLSNDVDLIITLSRAAGDSVGSYTITAQSTLIADNSNYDISITEGSYTITTRKVTLVMDYMTKVYGETDPDVTYSVDNLVDGDAEPFTVIFSRTTGEDVGFYVYRATITTTNSNYSVSLQSSKLTVTAATPSAVNVKDIEIEYAYELATVTPTATASATYLGSNTTVSGTLSWVDDSQLMLASGTYSAIFVPNSANYSSVDVEVYVTLIARELEVEFSYDDLTYTGTTQTPISYTIKNIREGDTVGDALTYSATVLNIGEYTATVSITNNSYVLVNATLDFEIDAAKLVVYAEDLVSTTAETPVATYVYEGFVGSDSAAVLVVKPTIDFATEIGTYTVTPYGAEAANYSITYKSSQFTLNQAQIASDSTSFVLYGSFDEDNSVAVAEIFSELDANFAAYSAAYDSIKVDTNYSSTSLQNLYSFGLLSAGSSATLVDNCTASIAIPEEISNASNITIVLIMADGSVKYAENVYISSNNIYFDMEDCVAFGIVATPNYTLLYIAIGAGAVIIIALIVVIVTKIKKRKQGHD